MMVLYAHPKRVFFVLSCTEGPTHRLVLFQLA